MKPTEEQYKIINAVKSGNNLHVAAFAGTGKTTTLELIGRQYSTKQGLYLAYNRAILDDSKGKFPKNITCKTTHSLAYATYGRDYREKLNNRITSMKVADHLEISLLRHHINGKIVQATSRNIAACATRIVAHYCNSADTEIGIQHLSMFHIKMLQNRYKKEEIELELDKSRINKPKNFLECYARICLQEAERLWQCMVDLKNHTIGITHDGYLKLYQLSKPILNQYDFIMLDEAQDANPAILDIFERQTAQRIYVGDQHQQIYSWRGSINAMEQMSGEKHYLTQSFRFGQPIADFANEILKKLGESQQIQANPNITSKLDVIDPSQPFTTLCRTNAGLLTCCLQHIELGRRVACVGGIKEALSDFTAAYYLWRNELDKVISNKIKLYQTWQNLVDEASLTGDRELKGIIKFILEHDEYSLEVIGKIKEAVEMDESKADVILSTAHKAKGRQWSQVLIHNDFEDYKSCSGEELNLWYVAATRAIHILDFSEISKQEDLDKPKSQPKQVAVATEQKLEEFVDLAEESKAASIIQNNPNKSSQWLKLKMHQKGIATNIAAKLLPDCASHDREVALCLAHKKWPKVKAKDTRQRISKLAGFLGRQGFSADLCWEVASLQEKLNVP
ncbi:UvrD-helicase domain-containing protein [Piscirickettsia salmonis]|uniref:UvrD-helicase domain-containing protein n=1 Tax=Piscirickettsia salmonis TaxID=1238 RepID=UPI00065F36C8|nr:RecX family transcriptional regulator [Piscirickettsia salmonis]AKP74889.1 hypothetical protein PSLF89_1p61 [Piscirickettsia salmonis LF-89 = ATCC VR-1361]